MIEEPDFETFLYVSNYRYQISVFDKQKLENLYCKEFKINNNIDSTDLNYLSKFLDDNIYKIEKLIGNFIKNIIFITEQDENLSVNITIKKKNYERVISQKYIETNLTEIKDLFKENYQEQIIMHMQVVNYIANKKKYSSYIDVLDEDHLCIEVNFVSIPNNLALIYEKLLEKYQIKISQYMCGNYIKNFFPHDSKELSLMAHKLKNGLNNNEIILVPKNIVNKGFFEKFFQLFS